MPVLSQGDIFQAVERVQLCIVFGHIGFNQMHHCWQEFRSDHPEYRQVLDPFQELGNQPTQWAPGKWLWFVADAKNHGMTEDQLAQALDAAFRWASGNGITTIATNGIADIQHTAENHAKRAQWLKSHAEKAERQHGFSVELISLNDVFVNH